MTTLFALSKNESGGTAIEYALLAGLIALVIITAVTGLGINLSARFVPIVAGLSR